MDGPCVFDDDFGFVREHILEADAVAFASPMYYFGLSSQLKAVIDRFYAISSRLHTPKKAVGGVDSPKKEKVSGKSDGRERKSPCSAGTGGVETA